MKDMTTQRKPNGVEILRNRFNRIKGSIQPSPKLIDAVQIKNPAEKDKPELDINKKVAGPARDLDLP
ncbi:MAG: hypothetical protein AAB425_11375 [Bdellovibrionota bacterium]